MENNENTNPTTRWTNNDLNFRFILRWLRPLPTVNGSPDIQTLNTGLDADEFNEIGIGGDFMQERSNYPLIIMVIEYQTQMSLVEDYERTRERLSNPPPPNIHHDISRLLQLASETKEGEPINSSYIMDEDSNHSSPSNSPTSTDSEVYRTESEENLPTLINSPVPELKVETPVVDEEQTVTLAEQTVPAAVEKTVPSPEQTAISQELPAPLRDSLLLRACIIDISNLPINGISAAVTEAMLNYLFAPDHLEELAIARHFLRYRIATAIEELNVRIAALASQEEEVREEVQPEELEEEDDDSWTSSSDISPQLSEESVSSENSSQFDDETESSESYSSENSDDTSDSYSDSYESFSDYDSVEYSETIPESPTEYNTNTTGTSRMYRFNPVLDNIYETNNNLEDDIVSETQNDSENIINGDQESSPEPSEIIIEDESWSNDGRTERVVQLMNEMLTLNCNERKKLLVDKDLNEQETYAIQQFMLSLEDTNRNRRGSFWSRIRAAFRKNHKKSKGWRLIHWGKREPSPPGSIDGEQ